MGAPYSRRAVLQGALAAGGLSLLAACGGEADAHSRADSEKLTPAKAWARLVEGNRHWAAGDLEHPDQTDERRRQVAAKQAPFATVVSCIDSRVPPETVFDQGVGDLFVVRTGAQTLDDLVTASVEYGPVEKATPLIVVMGHQRCGAVEAAVESIEHKQPLPAHLDKIVEALKPAYATARTQGGDLVDRTVQAQILRTVQGLQADPALAGKVKDGSLGLAGAYYSLDTGKVSLLTTAGFSPAP